MNTIEEITKSLEKMGLSPKEKIEVFLNMIKNVKKEELQPYEIVDLVQTKPSLPVLSASVLKNLQYNDEIVSSDNSFKAFINTDSSTTNNEVILELKENNLKLLLPLPEKLKKEFYLNVKTGNYFCEGEIRYSPERDIFSVHYLKIYSYQNIFNVWSNMISKISNGVKSRIDFIISSFGLEPNNLLYMEKIVFLLRLIPLVEKKYLMVDISKREIGKSYLYTMLGLNLYTTCITRSTAFIDGRNGKEGDFFSENVAYIIDEIGKLNDLDLITAIQVYKNGDRNIGTIQTGKGNKKSSNSIILLGNPKINIDFNRIFRNKTNIFYNTVIDKNGDSTAFLSRVDSLIPSYGCRTFNSSMLNKNGKNEEFIDIFKNVLTELREKELNISELLKKYNFSISFSPREEDAIFKTLEGLLKLLYPEIFTKNDNEIFNKEIFEFLLTTAIQTRQTVTNQIAIIEGKDFQNILYSSKYKNTYFNFKNGEIFYTPHRIFLKEGQVIRAIPLDTIGIELNKLDKSFLTNVQEIGIEELTYPIYVTDYMYSDFIINNPMYSSFIVNNPMNTVADTYFNPMFNHLTGNTENI